MNAHPRLVLAAALACALPSLRAQRMELADLSAAAVTVESADIRCEVTGRIAVTTLDVVFRNPNHRALEGTFALPLLDGQTVVRFALDVNGAMREAVPVDKVKGRVVFEEIERRRVDPGLLEQTAGNNYRARVFPIPAHGTRRILVAYQEDVARSAAATYRLNLDFPEVLKKFHLEVAAFSAGPAAKITSPPALELPAWREGQRLEVTRTDFTARGVLEIVLPPLDRPRVLTGRHGGDEYFYAEAPVAIAPKPRAVPRTLGLIWDSSGSGADRDHARELALLDAWFTQVRDVDVRLVRLRDRAEVAGTFTIRDGAWSELRTALETTAYDGATALDDLADDPGVDEWLLFSDGLINYGATPATKQLKLRRSVHTVLASARADPAWLRGVASRQSGEFVNLLELTPAAAAVRLRTRSPRVLRVDYNPNEAIDVFPEPGAVVTDGALIFTGALQRTRATIKAWIGTDESNTETVQFDVVSGENITPLAPRGWAAAKVAQLSLDAAANRADVRRTSREFGLVSADTSLLVLETLADYVRYDITPPAELLREWKAHRSAVATERRKDRDLHLESIVRLFNERVAWWEREFPKDAPKHSYQPEAKTGGFVFGAAAPARASSAPTPPPLAPSIGGSAFKEGDEVIVLQPFSVSAEPSYGFSASATATSSRSRASAPRTRDLAAESTATPAAATIALQRWSPDAGYLDRIRRAAGARAYAIYLEERTRHSRQPGFFLDVAHFFFERNEPALALRILSNLAELELEDVALLRVLAHRLTQATRPELARPLFERVLALRPDEPQSRRDLALVCADLGQHQRAVDLLWEVVAEKWSDRFPEIGLIALNELNAIAATCGETLDLSRVDRRLRRNLPVQTRVVLTWDANDTDIDLWVGDPNGETALYKNPLTYQGGRMSRDFTGGYGPEEFLLRAPKPGTYGVKIDYYTDRRQTALGPVTAQVRLITGFGTPAQKEQRLTVRLDAQTPNGEVGTITIGTPEKQKRATD